MRCSDHCRGRLCGTSVSSAYSLAVHRAQCSQLHPAREHLCTVCLIRWPVGCAGTSVRVACAHRVWGPQTPVGPQLRYALGWQSSPPSPLVIACWCRSCRLRCHDFLCSWHTGIRALLLPTPCVFICLCCSTLRCGIRCIRLLARSRRTPHTGKPCTLTRSALPCAGRRDYAPMGWAASALGTEGK